MADGRGGSGCGATLKPGTSETPRINRGRGDMNLIVVTWRLNDGTTGKAEFEDERLDEILERCWRKFGNPGTEKSEEARSEPYRGRGMAQAKPRLPKAAKGRY